MSECPTPHDCCCEGPRAGLVPRCRYPKTACSCPDAPPLTIDITGERAKLTQDWDAPQPVVQHVVQDAARGRQYWCVRCYGGRLPGSSVPKTVRDNLVLRACLTHQVMAEAGL